jgi:hypothetical protein
MGLTWDIALATGAPRTVVEAGAKQLAEVAAEYAERSGNTAHLEGLVKRCIIELRARHNHVPAVKILVHTVECWVAAWNRQRRVGVVQARQGGHGGNWTVQPACRGLHGSSRMEARGSRLRP